MADSKEKYKFDLRVKGIKLFGRLCSSLESIMKERMAVRRNIIDIEAADRDLQIRLYRKVWILSLIIN